MAASGYTPISLYYSTTASAAPTAGNLVSGELAINITDGKLYYKDNAGAVQLLSTSTTATGTANGVLYLNGSKVATSGTALVFDGTTLSLSPANLTINNSYTLNWKNASGVSTSVMNFYSDNNLYIDNAYGSQIFRIGSSGSASERMRLTTTGLGIGTSSPSTKLHVAGTVVSNQGVVKIQDLGGSGTSSYPVISLYDAGGTIQGNLGMFAGDQVVENKTASGKILFKTNSTTVGTLDSSGNLGLGVTPSAWGSSYRAFEITGAGNAISSSGTAQTLISDNAYDSGAGAWKYGVGGAYAALYALSGAQHIWYNTSSTQGAGNAITWTQAMTLDASGNLLIGATSGSSKLVVGGSSGPVGTPTAIQMDGTYRNTTAAFDALKFYLYKGASESYGLGLGNLSDMQYWAGSSSTGSHIWFTSQTERARIDASGNLCIGTTDATAVRLKVQNGTNPIVFLDGFGSAGTVGVIGANPLAFYTNGTERARIDSSGNFLIGKTGLSDTGAGFAFGGGSNAGLSYFARSSGIVMSLHRYTTTGDIVRFVYDGTSVGTISVTGSATAYNTSSDYRLKNIDGPLTGSGAFIDALKPKVGTWKADGSRFVGFIAHEVQEVSPGSVTGEKDGEEMQAMEYGSAEFIANIIAELQSLRARVAQLEAKGA